MNITKMELGEPVIGFTRYSTALVMYEPGADRAAEETRAWGDRSVIPFAATRLSMRADWDGTQYVLDTVTISGRRFKKSGEVGLVGAEAKFAAKPGWSTVGMDKLPSWAACEVAAIMARIGEDGR